MERAQTSVAVLVVEDEALIRMMFEDVLLELGHSIAAQASDLATGLTFAKERDYRLAILDVNLSGRQPWFNQLSRPIIGGVAEHHHVLDRRLEVAVVGVGAVERLK